MILEDVLCSREPLIKEYDAIRRVSTRCSAWTDYSQMVISSLMTNSTTSSSTFSESNSSVSTRLRKYLRSSFSASQVSRNFSRNSSNCLNSLRRFSISSCGREGKGSGLEDGLLNKE